MLNEMSDCRGDWTFPGKCPYGNNFVNSSTMTLRISIVEWLASGLTLQHVQHLQRGKQ